MCRRRLLVNRRVPHGALPRLERCAVKVARTVLKGRGGGDVTPLPDISAPFTWTRGDRLRTPMSYAQRVKGVSGIDMETCRECGGPVRLIACIEDPVVIKKILTHLDEQVASTQAPRLPETRAPPRADGRPVTLKYSMDLGIPAALASPLKLCMIEAALAKTVSREEVAMGWQEQLNKAIGAVREAADSETARDLAAKAKATAADLAGKVRGGAVDAADALVEANRDPSSLRVRFLNAELTVLSPSEGISITRPDAASLVVADGQGNGLVINAAVDPAFVAKMIGSVARLSGNTFDLGSEDGVNVVVTKF